MNFDVNEVKKFSEIADEWWKENGKFRVLHKINPLRLEYIKDQISKHYLKNDISSLENLEILDIGCGGGILSEAVAKEKAIVTALDPSKENIEVAKFHAEKSSLIIDYRQGNIEDLIMEGKKFDVIMAMEVVEHVPNVDLFIRQISKVLKNDGIIFFSTINRNIKSYLSTIILAEYILRWIPIKTHQWDKYIKPHEMEKYLKNNNLISKNYTGMRFDISCNKWILSDKLDVNYFTTVIRAKNV